LRTVRVEDGKSSGRPTETNDSAFEHTGTKLFGRYDPPGDTAAFVPDLENHMPRTAVQAVAAGSERDRIFTGLKNSSAPASIQKIPYSGRERLRVRSSKRRLAAFMMEFCHRMSALSAGWKRSNSEFALLWLAAAVQEAP
jgi:hypothetical protein